MDGCQALSAVLADARGAAADAKAHVLTAVLSEGEANPSNLAISLESSLMGESSKDRDASKDKDMGGNSGDIESEILAELAVRLERSSQILRTFSGNFCNPPSTNINSSSNSSKSKGECGKLARELASGPLQRLFAAARELATSGETMAIFSSSGDSAKVLEQAVDDELAVFVSALRRLVQTHRESGHEPESERGSSEGEGSAVQEQPPSANGNDKEGTGAKNDEGGGNSKRSTNHKEKRDRSHRRANIIARLPVHQTFTSVDHGGSFIYDGEAPMNLSEMSAALKTLDRDGEERDEDGDLRGSTHAYEEGVRQRPVRGSKREAKEPASSKDAGGSVRDKSGGKMRSFLKLSSKRKSDNPASREPHLSQGAAGGDTAAPITDLVGLSSDAIGDAARATIHASYTTDNAKSELLPGEIVEFEQGDIHYKMRERQRLLWKGGKLVITNFRVLFYYRNSVLVSVPLAALFAVEKIGGKKSSKTMGSSSAYLLSLVGKDNRRTVFNFEKVRKEGQNSRKNVFQLLSSYLIVDPRQTFAFLYEYYDCAPAIFDAVDDGVSLDLEEVHAASQQIGGWDIYNFDAELKRIGAISSDGEPSTKWRTTNTNGSFKLCSTYPRRLCVPRATQDVDLVQVASYRSRGRIPVLSWLHRNTAALVRCSQPKSGLRNKRNEHDESMLSQIVATNQATGSLQIIDARPRINARANQVQGAGSEVISHYDNCTMSFEDIENIHVMRDSWKLITAACNSDPVSGSSAGGGGQAVTDDTKWLSAVESSGWLGHISKLLLSATKIADLIDHQCITVLVHCSDGWDRTPQLTALAMLLLDPYYRTIRGFEVLIEQEWCSYGHQFALRCGVDGQNRPNERSPIFIQWLDCVYQVVQQYPCEFEFTERLLAALADELHACRFGTFLFDNVQQRIQARVRDKTPSLWSWVNRNDARFRNALFKSCVGVLQPSSSIKRLRLWEGHFFQAEPELQTPMSRSLADRGMQMQLEFEQEKAELKSRIIKLEKKLAKISERA